MKAGFRNTPMITEEIKAEKLFLWLFYIFYITFELVYYYISPKLFGDGLISRPKEGLGIWFYIIIFMLLPIAIYILRKGNPYFVKYLYIICFLLLDIIHNLMIFLGTDDSYTAGHIVEVLFILFCPIFVNKRYLWTVSIGVISKYIFMGVVLQDTIVFVPIVSYLIISAIAYVILIRFFSYISSLTAAHEELRQKEKLAVIGQMAAAIGHEIRNPLASLRGFTQLQQQENSAANKYYPIMIQEIDRINSIVDDLMYLGKPRSIKFEKANIEEIIAYTLPITLQQAEQQRVTIETIMAGPLPPLDCDSKQLKQVMINLIKNAIESMPTGGNIQIKVNISSTQKMLISVKDEGCGINDSDIQNLGEPFFTTKQDGTGLGLMVTNQIINDHNGAMRIQSSQESGTKVTVELPITQNMKK
ncbi:MAG: ATP-binding protein [Neobacillus sp.]